jgi:hypothetical protein
MAKKYVEEIDPVSRTVTIHEVDDAVDHPNHYNKGKIEAIEIIEDWDLNFNLGNVIKYTLRAPYKGETLQDLKKAQWYLTREIARRSRG